MKTIRIFHLIDLEMDVFDGPENFFCKHVPNEFRRIVNIRMNTEGMSDTQKSALRAGNLPQPWFMAVPLLVLFFRNHDEERLQ